MKSLQNHLNVKLVVFILLRTHTYCIWEFASLIHQFWNALSHYFIEYYIFSSYPLCLFTYFSRFYFFISLSCILYIYIPFYHILSVLNLWFNMSVEFSNYFQKVLKTFHFYNFFQNYLVFLKKNGALFFSHIFSYVFNHILLFYFIFILFFCPHPGLLIDFRKGGDTIFKFNTVPWLVWLSGLSTNLWAKGPLVQFPVRAHAWVVDQFRFPVRGMWEATTHLYFSPSLPPFPLSKINK